MRIDYYGKASGRIKDLSQEKLSIKNRGYDGVEVKSFVDSYYHNLKNNIKLTENDILLPTPSTTSLNSIPLFACEKLSKDFNVDIIDLELISIKTDIESKHCKDLLSRSLEPIDFNIDVEQLSRQVDGKNIVIIDDFISNGETIVNLSFQLRDLGFNVKGAGALDYAEKRLPSINDLKRVQNKILDIRPNLDKDKLAVLMYNNFFDYQKYKIGRFEKSNAISDKYIDAYLKAMVQHSNKFPSYNSNQIKTMIAQKEQAQGKLFEPKMEYGKNKNLNL